ncbi:MAG: FMN-binding protein, partial [Clostridiales bacterium]|nr:FMN-binding protein [Clostridiales bacterium]
MNEFKRKQWTRIGLSIVAVVIAALFLTGIVGGKDMTYRLVDLKSETEQGFGGEVTVNAGLKGNTVRSLTIDTPNETEGLGKKASGEEFTGQFIGKEGPFAYGENGIEAISGATVTSNAVLKALNRAVTGETEPAVAEELKPEEPAAEEKPAEEQPAEKKSAEEQSSAAAEASEQGFGGNVTVHLELNEDQTVKSLAIDTPDETAGLGQRASEAEFTDQFIGKAGPFAYGRDGIDALSGATITSEAALKAINSFYGGKAIAEEQPADEKPAEEQPAETAEKTEAQDAAGGQVYGSYLSEKETDFSTIRVMVSTKNSEITDCSITSEAKSEGSDFLTDEIRTAWAKAIVENQTAETDAITGATLTFSAGAVKEA